MKATFLEHVMVIKLEGRKNKDILKLKQRAPEAYTLKDENNNELFKLDVVAFPQVNVITEGTLVGAVISASEKDNVRIILENPVRNFTKKTAADTLTMLLPKLIATLNQIDEAAMKYNAVYEEAETMLEI
mgnify:CR=1 FL=1